MPVSSSVKLLYMYSTVYLSNSPRHNDIHLLSVLVSLGNTCEQHLSKGSIHEVESTLTTQRARESPTCMQLQRKNSDSLKETLYWDEYPKQMNSNTAMSSNMLATSSRTYYFYMEEVWRNCCMWLNPTLDGHTFETCIGHVLHVKSLLGCKVQVH